MSDAVRVDVFSDYTCPWCYVGWARLEKAIAALPDEVETEVWWHPLEIHPEVPPEGMPVEELPYPPDVWERMQEALRQSAAAEGLEVGNRPKVSNTHRALMAGAYAQEEEPERFAAFHEGLFRAYFAEGNDLGSDEVLLDVAEVAGLEMDAFRSALAEGSHEAVLAETSRLAAELRIASTPTFVFGQRYAAVGAQSAELLAEAIRRVHGEAAGAHPTETNESEEVGDE